MKMDKIYSEIGEVICLMYIAGEHHPYISWYRLTKEDLGSRTKITGIIEDELLKRVCAEIATGDTVKLKYTSQDTEDIIKDFKKLKQLPGRELRLLRWPLVADELEETRNVLGTLRRNMLGINVIGGGSGYA